MPRSYKGWPWSRITRPTFWYVLGDVACTATSPVAPNFFSCLHLGERHIIGRWSYPSDASVHQIRSWIGTAVLLDAARVGSRAHRPCLWWTNLLPREVLSHAYEGVTRLAYLIVDNILDVGRRSQEVRFVDQSPMAVVNIVGQPRAALPTFVSYRASHAFRSGGPGLVWDDLSQKMEEPNADERERAMGLMTRTTTVPTISEMTRRQVLGQAMDLNCLTWIVSLGLAEQRRLRTTGITTLPLGNPLPTRTMKDLGMLKGPGIRIELTFDSPILRHPYRYSDMERALIQRRSQDLFEAGLVEISHGEYASATVMPAKKDMYGNWTDRRMCGD
ncbi:hypothetical protein R1sor_014310 [Riccia sorocarpa]|uniref:Uncharacterized protein n=1 Tax=Riccia sorocarpa TaxID=122646 RepID=A0ABD3HDA4_9MARC